MQLSPCIKIIGHKMIIDHQRYLTFTTFLDFDFSYREEQHKKERGEKEKNPTDLNESEIHIQTHLFRA